MKKIELNNLGRKVLVVLTWLITLSVVASLGISGAGFFGSLTFYVGILFLAFVYFNDEKLQNTVKKSLIVAFIFVLVFFGLELIESIFDLIGISSSIPYTILDVAKLAAKTAKYTVVAIFVLAELFDYAEKKAAKAQVESKEAKAEEVKEETSNEEKAEEEAQ